MFCSSSSCTQMTIIKKPILMNCTKHCGKMKQKFEKGYRIGMTKMW